MAPKDTGRYRSIMSVGHVCDRGNIITFSSIGGTILNDFIGNGLKFERAGGGVSVDSGSPEQVESTCFWVLSRTPRVPLGRNARDLVDVPVLLSEAAVEQHELTRIPNLV